MTAGNVVHVTNNQMHASVQGGQTTNGGNSVWDVVAAVLERPIFSSRR